MTVQVLNIVERKCPTCPKVVRHETLQSDVPGTKVVTVARCPSCDKR